MMLVLLAVKLAWVAGIPMSARWAVYDDAQFVQQARSILDGEWLGPYGFPTLMKGPVYPLFIALCHELGLPLSLAQHGLHAAMCVLAVVALRPLVRSEVFLVILFALCLLDPMSFHTAFLSGVQREGIYPAQSALVLLCAAAMLIRCEGPLARLACWALGLGLALGTFWLTREEGAWLLPSLSLLVAAGAWRTLRSRPEDAPWRLAVWSLPFALSGAMMLGVAALNRSYYGTFTVNEVRLPEFTAAYGALARVGEASFQPYVVLPVESRRRLYELSPAFLELRPSFEGNIGKRWQACAPERSIPGEITGGWFLWALRSAVAEAGHGASPADSLAFYRSLAQEVNSVCDRGLIECGPPLASLVPRWNPAYRDGFLASLRAGLVRLVTWSGFRAFVPASGGTERQIGFFREVTGSEMTPSRASSPLWNRRGRTVERAELLPGEADAEVLTERDAPCAWTGARMELLGVFGALFCSCAPWLVLAAVLAWMLRWFTPSRERNAALLCIELALLVAIVVRLLLLAYIDATSFPALQARYLAPLGPLLLLFCGLSLSSLPGTLAALRRRAC